MGRVGQGKAAQHGLCIKLFKTTKDVTREFSEVMDVFCVWIVGVDTHLFAFVETHVTVHHKINFTV